MTVTLTFLFLFIVFTYWGGVASMEYPKVQSTVLHKIYECEEGYQYITIDGNPVNITKLLGRVSHEGEVVKQTIYQRVYKGVRIPCRDDFEFFNQVEVEKGN